MAPIFTDFALITAGRATIFDDSTTSRPATSPSALNTTPSEPPGVPRGLHPRRGLHQPRQGEPQLRRTPSPIFHPSFQPDFAEFRVYPIPHLPHLRFSTSPVKSQFQPHQPYVQAIPRRRLPGTEKNIDKTIDQVIRPQVRENFVVDPPKDINGSKSRRGRHLPAIFAKLT